jgi:hypothetical protein
LHRYLKSWSCIFEILRANCLQQYVNHKFIINIESNKKRPVGTHLSCRCLDQSLRIHFCHLSFVICHLSFVICRLARIDGFWVAIMSHISLRDARALFIVSWNSHGGTFLLKVAQNWWLFGHRIAARRQGWRFVDDRKEVLAQISPWNCWSGLSETFVICDVQKGEVIIADFPAEFFEQSLTVGSLTVKIARPDSSNFDRNCLGNQAESPSKIWIQLDRPWIGL